jgi:hypothetical protein
MYLPRKLWGVDVGWPTEEEYENVEETINDLAEKYKIDSRDSGQGFGYRDIQYVLKRKKDAKKLADEIRHALGIVGTSIISDTQPYVGMYQESGIRPMLLYWWDELRMSLAQYALKKVKPKS